MPDELLRRGWMRLDNAAKIYPAAMRRSWTALFRFSANLTEAVDPVVLQQAVNAVTRRFPAFAVRLKRGVFWFYLQHTDRAPTIQQDVQNPCVPMDLKDNDRFLFRVRYYESRIACEYFHVLTDGTGGLLFLKTLVAEYLRLKYGAAIPRGSGLLATFTEPVDGKWAQVILCLMVLFTAGAMLLINPVLGGAAVLGAAVTFLYYRVMAYRQFGGITGDTEGFFLQLCECVMVLAMLIGQKVWGV